MAAKIPVIDMSGPDQGQVAHDLVEAAVEHGFVYIKNLGKDIPIDVIENAFSVVGPSASSLPLCCMNIHIVS